MRLYIDYRFKPRTELYGIVIRSVIRTSFSEVEGKIDRKIGKDEDLSERNFARHKNLSPVF